jgi:hypothetical protein
VSAEPNDLVIREYQPGDEHQIVETFNRVFSRIDPTFTGKTLEHWRWQYLGNPSGWRIWLAFTRSGQLISQYAGNAQRVLLEGQPAHFSQAVDSMTDPAFARGLKKPGYFVLTGYPYAANYGGPPPDHDTIMWGAPVPSAWRIGRTYLKYEMLRTQLKLTAPLDEVRLEASGGIEVEEVARFPEEIVALFERIAPEHQAIAVRDRAQMDWRYPDHPGNEYAIALAREAGELVGCTVFRSGVFDDRHDALACEWMRPADRPGAGHALRAWLVERAREAGLEHLTLVLPDSCADWITFQHAGFRAEPTKHFLVGRNYVKKYDMPWMRRHWYYTLGDTDLV